MVAQQYLVRGRQTLYRFLISYLILIIKVLLLCKLIVMMKVLRYLSNSLSGLNLIWIQYAEANQEFKFSKEYYK